jgi:hypothetical protein
MKACRVKIHVVREWRIHQCGKFSAAAPPFLRRAAVQRSLRLLPLGTNLHLPVSPPPAADWCRRPSGSRRWSPTPCRCQITPHWSELSNRLSQERLAPSVLRSPASTLHIHPGHVGAIPVVSACRTRGALCCLQTTPCWPRCSPHTQVRATSQQGLQGSGRPGQ